MRLVLGSALVVRASSALCLDPLIKVAVPAVVLIGAGILLIAGLWTPIAGTAVAVAEISKMLMLPGDKWLWLMVAIIGVAMAMLGPGLWSADARLYGWRRLEVRPHKPHLNSRS